MQYINQSLSSIHAENEHNSKTLFCVTCISMVIFLVSLVFFVLFQLVHVLTVAKYGVQGDTIVASDFNSFGLTSVTITECPDDLNNLEFEAALVKKSDVITYMANYTNAFNGTATTRENLFYEDLYLLQESFMAVNICLSSNFSNWEISKSLTVLAFVFDNFDDNQKFLLGETDGIHSSVYYTALPVGSISKPICTWVNYSIASPAYYYLALGEYTLGTLAFSADRHLHEIYLNITDYEGSEQYCSSDSEMQPCKFEFHDILKHKEYILVTYIRFCPISPRAHICTKQNKPAAAVIVPATVGAVSLLLMIILFVVCITVLYKCVKKRSMVGSHGYAPINLVGAD